LAGVRIRDQSVCIPLAAPAAVVNAGSLIRATRPRPQGAPMADVIFVGITIAFFGLLALIVKGVERLER
jgi:hypothetical protein